MLHRILEAIEKFGGHMPPRFMAGGVRVPPIPYPDCYRELPNPNPISLDMGGAAKQIIDIPCAGVVISKLASGAGSATFYGYPGEANNQITVFTAEINVQAYRSEAGLLFLPCAGKWTIIGTTLNGQYGFLPDPLGVYAKLITDSKCAVTAPLSYGDFVLAPVTDTQLIPADMTRRGLCIQNIGAAVARVTFDGSASAAARGIPLTPSGTSSDRIKYDLATPRDQVRAFSTAGTTLVVVESF
jgi:hypothetical protein